MSFTAALRMAEAINGLMGNVEKVGAFEPLHPKKNGVRP